MKLATYPGPTRDGRLIVVSRDLTRAAPAHDLAPTLLAAVEQWDDVADGLAARAEELEEGSAIGEFAFDPEEALAPLPRSPQWLDGSVFQTHLDLMAQALHPDKPNEPTDWPYVYQGASDDFLGARADIAGYRVDEGIDFEGEFAVIVGDVPMRVTPDEALGHVRLLMLCNDVSLRAYAGPEVRVGFGFLRAKPSTVFSSVAVTPDEFGGAWQDGRVHLPLRVNRSGEWFGHPHGSQMTFHFGDLVAHTATTRRLSAGTIVGSGTVSNDDRSVGSACIAERRAIEIIADGAPTTTFLAHGEEVHMEVLDADGRSVFGEIRNRVVVA